MRLPPISRRRAIVSIASAAVLPRIPIATGTIPGESTSFLAVGDWGRDGASHQRDVAAQMGRAAADTGARFVISVGDNFYEDGVQSTGDRQWRTSFEEVYTASSLQIPWYVALGNHDYRGVPQAQIDYTRVSSRWRMTSRYYKVTGASLGAPHLDLFVIDTSPLVHKYRSDVHSRIAANVVSQDVHAQLRWLDRELEASRTQWKLVIGHHTVYSGGSGHGDTPETKELLEPLLRKHGVQAYINGHDHDLQHIRRDGVDYVCCGAGSEVRPVEATTGTLFCRSVSGFASFTSTRRSLTVGFRDFAGRLLYEAPVPDRAGSTTTAS